jgi:hypothetical protein
MVGVVERRIEPLSTSSNFYRFLALGSLMCTTHLEIVSDMNSVETTNSTHILCSQKFNPVHSELLANVR